MASRSAAGPGSDGLLGFKGDDRLAGGPGSDALFGQKGRDRLRAAGASTCCEALRPKKETR